ncbi:Hsp20/alpha crystallin family protein [Rubripirellula reticaptiva]|uniref:Spore protein SP21 n=1 Tax=Rubripirellula reticaptiva TaxID=2528013 RepID=A0A5C6EF77_9BACT|nr:Hsp20/alpha crystallin family protein [Rubripirellula reticaptiva]TWU46677.1 Spore protein SP21 [Rubripirellula reticaptiva]
MAFQFTWPRELNRLQSEMDQLFGRDGGSISRSQAYPAINLLEDDDNLYVESEIPGMELDHFELFVNDENQLTIQGERKQPNGGTTTRHREERSFGRFSRMISLPALVDGDATTAEYVAGVLTITLPKRPEAKPRRIQVAAG